MYAVSLLVIIVMKDSTAVIGFSSGEGENFLDSTKKRSFPIPEM